MLMGSQRCEQPAGIGDDDMLVAWPLLSAGSAVVMVDNQDTWIDLVPSVEDWIGSDPVGESRTDGQDLQVLIGAEMDQVPRDVGSGGG